MNTAPADWHIGLVGYGEVGRILAEDLRRRGVSVSAYDVKLGTGAGRPLADHARTHGVRLRSALADLAAAADLIVSAVTACQAVAVAQGCAPTIKRGTWFLDFNSASPGPSSGPLR